MADLGVGCALGALCSLPLACPVWRGLAAGTSLLGCWVACSRVGIRDAVPRMLAEVLLDVLAGVCCCCVVMGSWLETGGSSISLPGPCRTLRVTTLVDGGLLLPGAGSGRCCLGVACC